MKSLFFCAALAMVCPGTAARAEIQSWYGCTHPEWRAVFGFSHLMVPATILNQFGAGQGVTCNLLDIDYESSRGRACYLAWQLPANTWGVWDGVRGTSPAALPCS